MCARYFENVIKNLTYVFQRKTACIFPVFTISVVWLILTLFLAHWVLQSTFDWQAVSTEHLQWSVLASVRHSWKSQRTLTTYRTSLHLLIYEFSWLKYCNKDNSSIWKTAVQSWCGHLPRPGDRLNKLYCSFILYKTGESIKYPSQR